jgi:hypothetical protein
VALLLGLTVVLWLWRVRCIAAGPDPDGDAYGHFVIARQLLETPLDLHIHWVWLPLHHLLLAAGISVGASLDHVRLANALLSALTPLLLGWGMWRAALRQTGLRQTGLPQTGLPQTGRRQAGLRSELASGTSPGLTELGVPLLAAALAALTPLSLMMGTTSQPEPTFAVLLLGAALLLGARRWALAALLLSAMVLLRYEAWAAAASVAALLLLQRCWPTAALLSGEGSATAPLTRGRLGCVCAPGLTVLGWAALRRLDGGGWFDFLRLNQRFAEDALSRMARPSPWQELRVLAPHVPNAVWLLLALGLLGVPRLVRRTSVWFVLLPLAIAAFLCLGWLLRSHLGLSRHWVGLVPFAAAAVAQGCAQLAEGLQRIRQPWAGSIGLAALSLLVLVPAARELPAPLAGWRQHTASAFPEQRDAARFLRGLPESAALWCDDAATEVLSQLPSERFVRKYLGQDAVAQLRQWHRSEEVVVLSQAERIREVLPFAELLYGDPQGAGLIALRVRPGELPARP